MPPVNKPEASGGYSPASPATASSPPQSASRNQKKTSPSTPMQQNTAHASKPPKLKDKDPSLQNSSLGPKRPISDEGQGSQKVKKKKIEKSSDGVSKSVPKEVSILGQPDDKGKTKTNPMAVTKKSDDIKERRKSSDIANEKIKVAKSGKDGKKESGKDMKGKDLKDKGKKDKTKKDDKNSDEFKVQKLTVKRTSTDAWASTTKNMGNRNAVFDALVTEFGAEISDSELEDLDDSIGTISKGINQDNNANENVKPTAVKGKKVNRAKSPSSVTPTSDNFKVNGTKKKDATR